MTKRKLDTTQVSHQVKKSRKQEVDPSAGLQNELGFTLIESDLDRPDLIEVAKVAIIGQYGAYAKQNIQKGTVLGEYTGKIIEDTFSDEDTSYYMDLPGSKVIDARKHGNFTRLVNHSDNTPNVEFQRTRQKNKTIIVLVALIDIPEGKQLLTNYGDLYNFHETMIYLDWDDNSVSASEFYKQQEKSYTILSLDEKFSRFNLKAGDSLAFPKIIKDKRQHSLANHPIFKVQNKKILSYNEFDCISMLAWETYSGDVDKVSFLLNHDASINRQQHKSGFTPLHMAVFGYEETGKTNYLTIIKDLIENNANLLITDKNDYTAFHHAALNLKSDALERVIELIPEMDFEKLLQLVDKDRNDLIFTVIKNKKLDNLTILLDKDPNYFSKAFSPKKPAKGRKKGAHYYTSADFEHVIEAYSPDDAQKLLEIIREYKIPSNYIVILEQCIEKANKPQEEYVTMHEVAVDVQPELTRSIQHTFFGSISVDVSPGLENYSKFFEKLSGYHQEYKKNYAEESDTEQLIVIKKSYLENQVQASKCLYKLCKYHASLSQHSLSDEIDTQIMKLKEHFGSIVLDDIENFSEIMSYINDSKL